MEEPIILYETESGGTPVHDFLEGLDDAAASQCVAYMLKLMDPGPPLPKHHAEKLEGDIWELKPEWGGTEYRLLYSRLPGDRFIILHAVKKKRRRLAAKETDTAQQRLGDWRERYR